MSNNKVAFRIISMNVFWRWYDILKSFFFLFNKNSFKDEAGVDLSDFFPHLCRSQFLGFNSGRSALLFTLQVFSKIRPYADEVVLPIYVCNGVLDPIIKAGLKPVFCDIGEDLNVDPLSCFKSITNQTLAVIIPHTYGHPADIKTIYMRLQKEYEGVFVIDDAASGMGNVSGEDSLGFSGDVGIFSLNQAKAFPTTGGGILTINSDHLISFFYDQYSDVPKLSLFSCIIKSINFFIMFKAPYYSNILGYYLHKLKLFRGTSGRSFDALSIFRLPKFDINLLHTGENISKEAHKKRKKIYQFYTNNLKGLMGLKFPQIPEGDNFFSRLPVYIPGLCKLKSVNDQDLLSVWKKKGVHFQYGYRFFGKENFNLECCEESFEYINDLLILPINHNMSADGHSVVVDAVKEIVAEVEKHF